MKHIFLIIAVLIVSITGNGIAPGVAAGAEATATIQSPGPVLETPSESGNVMVQLDSGDSIFIIEKRDNWCIVRLPDNRLGWMNSRLLEKPVGSEITGTSKTDSDTDSQEKAPADTETSTFTATVRVRSAVVRESPNRSSDLQFGLQQGDTVEVFETQDPWYHIRTPEGQQGWAHSKLFYKPEVSLSTPSAQTPHQKPFPAKAKAEPEADSMPESAPAEPFTGVKQISEIRVDRSKDGVENVVFLLSGFFLPKSFVIKGDEPKVVCDFPDTKAGKNLKKQMEINGQLIKRIRIGEHFGAAPKLRVVVDLFPDKDYVVDQNFYKNENLYNLVFKSSD